MPHITRAEHEDKHAICRETDRKDADPPCCAGTAVCFVSILGGVRTMCVYRGIMAGAVNVSSRAAETSVFGGTGAEQIVAAATVI
jgi:hypothetical protein